MTIVVAYLEGEAILIGADSKTSGEGADEAQMKLRRIPDAPVAWGCAGSIGLGDRFSEWLEKYRWPPQDWPRFEGNVRRKLADINREEREIVERSGAKWENDFGVTCLIAAWLDAKPHIASYYPDGIKGTVIRNEFDHIGSGSQFARVSYLTLRYVDGIPIEIRTQIILDATSRLAPDCGLPYNLLRVSAGGIEVVPPKVNSEGETPASQSKTGSNGP